MHQSFPNNLNLFNIHSLNVLFNIHFLDIKKIMLERDAHRQSFARVIYHFQPITQHFLVNISTIFYRFSIIAPERKGLYVPFAPEFFV